MTSTPSLPAQIEAVRRAIETRDHQSEQFEGARYDAEALRAILVTLQQHERLEAVVKAARRWHREEWSSWPADKIREGRRHTVDELDADDAGMALIDAIAALDTAAPDKPEDAERGLRRDG